MQSKSWHFNQLEKELKNRNRLGSDRIELINPDVINQLDQRLINDFWLPFQAAFNDSPLMIPENCLRNGMPEISNEYNLFPHRSFFFILENPKNPLHPENTFRNWFARIKVNAISDHYFLELEYFLYFPESIRMEKVLKLMRYPDFQPNPPELCWSEGFKGSKGMFDLKFYFGSGTNWISYTRDEWLDIIANKTGSLLSLVETSELSAMGGYDKMGMELLKDALVGVWKSWFGD